MNERIRELYETALVAAGKDKQFETTNLDVATKFAKLIVKECAGIYDKIDNGNLHMGTDNYLEALNKTFFGVEE